MALTCRWRSRPRHQAQDLLQLFGLDLTALQRSHLAFLERFRHAVIVPHSQPVALLDIRFRVLSFWLAVVSGIFFAVDRRQMRRISIEIWSRDSKFLAVCIDPFPQAFSGSASLRLCLAFDAHDIGCKPVAIAAAEAPAMV